MAFKTIVTLGPAILSDHKLKKADEQGECIYRINGSHVDENEVPNLVDKVRRILPRAKIMIDLPGNKIRTANLSEPIRLIRGERFFLNDYQINYPHFHERLKKGDRILANDSIFTLEVVHKTSSGVELLSHSDGLLSSNKGLHIKGIHRGIPFIFDKDRALIMTACSCGIDYISLSFVRTADDIREVKKILPKKEVHLIAKIETLDAVKNMEEIFPEVESVLVDRGDLSTEIDILDLADVQDSIIRNALRAKVDIYLATQFLKNMETYPIPLISEMMDLSKTMRSGISGIQLSEETAIGRYPVECIKLIFSVHRNMMSKTNGE